MKNEFQRERRYYVVKIADAKKYLTGTERAILAELLGKVTALRVQENKDPLRCVVVEEDWPEYETTWAAIEARMTTPNAGGNAT